MPGSCGSRRDSFSWPETPIEQAVPESFESTGECVIERILEPIRDKVPFLPHSRRQSLSCLSPGSLFSGYQNAAEESKQYPVEVAIKDVDLKESFLCGYLTIHNLTQEYPNLTTFFEAEIIGPKYSFVTDKWEAGYDSDKKHWEQFTYFKTNCANQFDNLRRGDYQPYNCLEREVVFMRWKEHFLVPDHHIETVHGASYAGFYYIAFERTSNEIEGYYYHRESKDYQKLYLKHVPTRSFPEFEFR